MVSITNGNTDEGLAFAINGTKQIKCCLIAALFNIL